MIRLVTDVDRLAARELFASCGAVKPRRGALAALQLAQSVAAGFARDGRLIALITGYPVAVPELGRPALEVSALGQREACRRPGTMLELVRLARLTLDAWGQNGTVALLGAVKVGHRPGQQLARLAGFRFAEVRQGFEVWAR